MNKLIDAFRKLPSPTNRHRLATYLARHPMATCLATPEQIAFLKIHEFEV